jgi:Protein of unknown function (DUF2934)
MSTDAATTMPERISVNESVKTTATVIPPESEIAILAYQFWQDNGCPVGSHQEDWFRAEEMLKRALVANCEDLLKRPSIPRYDTRTESEMLADLRWGHWEVWEMEWGGARWIWDLRPTPSVEILNRAG